MVTGTWKTLVYTMLLTLLFSCSKDQSTENNKLPFTLAIRPFAFGTLIDTSKTYVNGSGEAFKINKLKFYISGITFHNPNGQNVQDSSFHLIDMYDTSSQRIMLNIERGNYDSLQFSIGVDSIHNVSGAQSGALDPTYGMFWTWNTGYIYVKFEGTSPVSTAPNQRFTYHIGGFKTGENALRTIRFPVSIDIDKHAGIEYAADVANWFDGSLKMATYPTIMTPGPIALNFADNYAKMFSIIKIVSR